MNLCRSSASARAEARSWPNGFSTTTRWCPRDERADVRQSLDHEREQRGRDLQVEDRVGLPLERRAACTCRRREVAAHVVQPLGESREHPVVELLARLLDRVAARARQLVEAPVVRRHAEHGQLEQPAALEPVERAERHLARQVAGDPEDHQRVCLLLRMFGLRSRRKPYPAAVRRRIDLPRLRRSRTRAISAAVTAPSSRPVSSTTGRSCKPRLGQEDRKAVLADLALAGRGMTVAVGSERRHRVV